MYNMSRTRAREPLCSSSPHPTHFPPAVLYFGKFLATHRRSGWKKLPALSSNPCVRVVLVGRGLAVTHGLCVAALQVLVDAARLFRL